MTKGCHHVFNRTRSAGLADAVATVAALAKSYAVIEFDLDGRILTANPRFLDALGYTLPDVQGQHHSIFLPAGEKDLPSYKAFWQALNRGECQVAEFKRIGKGGREVWIEATYNPLLGPDGRPFRVVKFATDVTGKRLAFANLAGQVSAIQASQAVVEFDLGGHVLTANANFLDVLGYTLDEVVGKHHSLFVPDDERDTPGYTAFWHELRDGAYQTGQFTRVGKGGRKVCIQASYNPILDLNGRPFKIVKYATDISAQAELLANLRTMIGQVDDAVARSSRQADQATTAAAETFSNVGTMSASTEQLAASIGEIAQMMTKSNTATETANAQAATAEQATQRLTATSKSMGGIVALIRNIAGQINLLALNATIESARAGPAGRGFAVVAGEVKSLAQQAQAATDRIADEIGRLQTVSVEVVSALAEIGVSIGSVREYVLGTTSAVEQQSAVTREMSARMQRTAAGVTAINDNMSGIATAVGQVSHALQDTKRAAQTLSR